MDLLNIARAFTAAIFSQITVLGNRFCLAAILIFFFASCNIVRNAPEGKPYLFKNKIEVKGTKLSGVQKSAMQERLFLQLDDSAVVKTNEKYFFLKYTLAPPAFDTGYVNRSARDMEGSLFHIGYYSPRVSYRADTSGRRVSVTYIAEPGKQTLIDTVRYALRRPELQQMALDSRKESLLQPAQPITKASVLGEISRLVDSFRNNGYYKFTAAELRVRGDTTIEALTSVTADPFEQLELLAEAQARRDSPEIKLAVVLVPPSDSSRLSRFYINRVYVMTDFRDGDLVLDTVTITERVNRNLITRFHQRTVRTGFLLRNITLRPNSLYRQTDYATTINNLAKTGLWQTVNIDLTEIPGDSNKLDVIIELVPSKKLGFQAALEASYSASNQNSTVVAGNLFGISGNLSLLNRNLGKEGIRMTHSVRVGIELNNNNSRGAQRQLINSNEIGYSNTIAIPKVLIPRFRALAFGSSNPRQRRQIPGETFISTGLAYNNRLNLFNLQTVNLNFGYNLLSKRKLNVTVRPFFFGFTKLFNETDSFRRIIDSNLFLQYSYNTALVLGAGAGISRVFHNPVHPHSKFKERSIRANVEESGLTWAQIPILNRYKRRYIKADAEYRYTVDYRKTSIAFRTFLGVGVPLLGSDSNRALPFFKQYFGGGSNSMRGWPVRGIGPGSRPLTAFNSSRTFFNDRTGDMQFEMNVEYRYQIARLISNTANLRGALFIDAGNVWNLLNTRKDGSPDSAQFRIKTFYRDLGISAGTGFRVDFNYLIVRFDLGFRFKRPETAYVNDGWKIPSLSFNDFLKKFFTRGPESKYRRWRYENFNFTIGIGYAF